MLTLKTRLLLLLELGIITQWLFRNKKCTKDVFSFNMF